MNALHSLQTAAVSIRSVRKVYGDPASGPVALKCVDLDIRDNEFFTLLGPSGCGKTTLLRMIAGFEFPPPGKSSCTARTSPTARRSSARSTPSSSTTHCSRT